MDLRSFLYRSGLPYRVTRCGRKSPVSDNFDVVLHIGPPKAGTSALQAFFHDNLLRLKRAGFYYPYHGLDRNRVSGGHSQLGALLRNEEAEPARELFGRWLAEARRLKCCLLLSAESFAHHAAEFADLTQGLRVLIVAYYRHPLQTLVSGYNQAVKRSFMTMALDAFLLRQFETRADAGWMRITSGVFLDGWADRFGVNNLRVRPLYGPLFPGERIEFAMAEMLGLPDTDYRAFRLQRQLVNVGYTPETLELKRLLNFVLDQDDEVLNQQVDTCLQAYSDSRGQTSARLLQGVDDAVLERFRQKLNPTCAHLRQTFFVDIDDAHWRDFLTGDMARDPVTLEPLDQVVEVTFRGKKGLRDALCALTRSRLEAGEKPAAELKRLADLLAVPG